MRQFPGVAMTAPYGAEATAARSPEGRPLGISAKSSPLRIDLNTGEVVFDGEYDAVGVRLERFALQSVVRRFLWGSRTAKCLRLRRRDKASVEVWKSKEHGSASFGGLQTCGSVWACPVCASKISERRRGELLNAIDQHKASGGEVLLLTLTNPHYSGDRLADLLKGQALAMSRFNSTKAALALWSWMGCIGTVRAWEVTQGENGWHPHFHLLAFVRASVSLSEARNRVYAVWSTGCRLAGLPVPSEVHGVDVRDGSEAAAYASKWGLDQEMTKGHMKKAKKGRTPFDLLRAYLYDEDKHAMGLFKGYVEAFKGKRQLVWSKGLKEHFRIGEESDEEIAARQDDRAFLLGEITVDEWRKILRFDVRGEVLELARHGWEPVRRFLDSLPGNEK